MELTLQEKIAVGQYVKAYQKNPLIVDFAQKACEVFVQEICDAPRTNRTAKIRANFAIEIFEAEKSPVEFKGYNTVAYKETTLSFYEENIKAIEDKLQARALINAIAALILKSAKEQLPVDPSGTECVLKAVYEEEQEKLIIKLRYRAENGYFVPPVDLLAEEEKEAEAAEAAEA